MQLLPSFHLLLTCCFVLLLAYLLSRIFSFLASFVVAGASAPPRVLKQQKQRQKEELEAEEEDETAHDQYIIRDATHDEVANSGVFDDGGAEQHSPEGSWSEPDEDKRAEMADQDHFDAPWSDPHEGAVDPASLIPTTKLLHEKKSLDDPEGSFSKRLPPTWSDLEKIVNSSKKHHDPPPED